MSASAPTAIALAALLLGAPWVALAQGVLREPPAAVPTESSAAALATPEHLHREGLAPGLRFHPPAAPGTQASLPAQATQRATLEQRALRAPVTSADTMQADVAPRLHAIDRDGRVDLKGRPEPARDLRASSLSGAAKALLARPVPPPTAP
jgi:hypothetical protein